MKIENIIVSNENLTQKSATIAFDVIDVSTNAKVYIKIDEQDYKLIMDKQENGNKTYNLVGLQNGINNANLKLVEGENEYISEPFLIKIKEKPSIQNLNCIYTDSTGKYRLQFDLLGDSNFKHSIYLKIDGEEYQEVAINQVTGTLIIESTNTLGKHTINLRVTDGYDEYEIASYSIEIKNIPPILSKVIPMDFTESSCSIYYSAKDIEGEPLIHKLKINDGEYTTIIPTSQGNFYSYEIKDLISGVYFCSIQVDDGIDVVTSDEILIQIFEPPTDNKEALRQAKVRYDDAYNNLRGTIVSSINDMKFDYDVENPIIQKAQDNYKIEYSNFNKIVQQSIDAIGTKKVSISKEELTNQINDVDNAVNTLESTMNTTFKDGVLSDSEKSMIHDNIHLVEKEKVDIDEDYNTLYNNADLVDPTKRILKERYDAFEIVHTNLITTLNDIVAKTGIVDNTDKENVDNAFEDWKEALGEYRTASLNAIDSISKKQIDDSETRTSQKIAEIIITQDSITQRVSSVETRTSNITERISEIENEANKSVKSVDIYYYLSTSQTELSGGQWTTDAPAWEEDKFLWSKTVTTLADNSTKESKPVCISASNGLDGDTFYTWIKYADDANGTGLSNDPTNKSYIGFAYNKDTKTESNVASDYEWSKFKGEDGQKGSDGTSVTILGSYASLDALNAAHPDNNINGDGYIVNGDLYVWDGTQFLNVGKIKGDDGKDGKDGENGTSAYMHIKYSNDGGLTFTPSNGEEAGDYIGVYSDDVVADSTDVSRYTWSRMKGEDGIPGEKGKDGTTTYTWIKYSNNADGSGLYDTPNSETVYIGIATNKTTPTESNVASDYKWSKFRGDDGVDGRDGVSVSTITNYYLASSASSGVTTSTSGWTTTVQTPTSSKQYLWNYEKITYSNKSTTSTNPCIIGNYSTSGTNGKDGKGISTITNYYLASASSSGVTTATSGWTTTIQTPTESKRYLWNYEMIKYTDNTSASTTPCIIGNFSKDGLNGTNGKGIVSITEYYLATTASSGITTSTSGWTASIQTPTDTKKYLWNYEVISYTDGTSSTGSPKVIGVHGDTGVGISSIDEYYLASASASGVTTSTSGWTLDVQSMTDTKKYLWNYEVFNYTNNTKKTGTPRIIGVYGAKGSNGQGISAITEQYYLSTSKTTQSGGSWVTSPPVWTKGKYMWTRTKIDWINPTATTYTVPICDTSWEMMDELAKEINIKVDETNETLAETVTTLDSITSRVSSVENKTTTITQKIDNMRIGGRNLVTNSAFLYGTTKWSLHSGVTLDTSKTFEGHPTIKITSSGETSDRWRGATNGNMPSSAGTEPFFEKGEAITLSGWYYVEDKSIVDTSFAIEIKGKTAGTTNEATVIKTLVSPSTVVEGAWTRISVSATLNNAYQDCYLYVWVQRNGIVWFTDFKVEKGNQLTDWTPAPEDADSAIGNLTTEIEEVTEQMSELAIKTDSITSRVSSVETTTTNVSNTLNNMQIGGRNFVLNSAFLNGTSKWSLATNCTLDTTRTRGGHPSCKSSQSGFTSNQWRGCSNYYMPKAEGLESKFGTGETLTVSCWYYVEDKSTFDARLALEMKGKVTGTTNEATIITCFIGSTSMVQGAWTRISGTVTLNKNWEDCCIRAWIEKNGTAWFTDFKVEKGNKVTDWSPAPEDAELLISEVEERVSTAEQKITSSAIVSTVTSSTTYKDLANKVSTNTTNISTISQKADSIEISVGKKADKGSIISTINASSESITISTNKLNLTGYATFTSLSTAGATTINGSNIKTGTIDASKATITNINASNITTGTLSANRISGGTIDASKISVTNLNASNITSGSLSANRISGGTIDASKISVTNLNASNITSGTISGNRIRGGVIEGTTLKTVEPSTSGGVWIKQNGMQIGTTSVHYSSQFKIESQGNMSISTGSGSIYMMPASDVSITGGLKVSSTLTVSGSGYIYGNALYLGSNSNTAVMNSVTSWTSNGNQTGGCLRTNGGYILQNNSGVVYLINRSGNYVQQYCSNVYLGALGGFLKALDDDDEEVEKVSATELLNRLQVVSSDEGYRTIYNPISTLSDEDDKVEEQMKKLITSEYNEVEEDTCYILDVSSNLSLLTKAFQEQQINFDKVFNQVINE